MEKDKKITRKNTVRIVGHLKENLLEKQFSLFSEMIYNPLIEDNCFTSFELEKEKKNILLTYVFIGVLLGFAAILNASKGKVEAASNLSSTNLMFSSMGPVLVGLFLEQYSTLPFGVFVGALGFNVITYGLQALSIDSSIQTIITGIAIVLIMTYTTNQELLKNIIRNTFSFKKKEA